MQADCSTVSVNDGQLMHPIGLHELLDKVAPDFGGHDQGVAMNHLVDNALQRQAAEERTPNIAVGQRPDQRFVCGHDQHDLLARDIEAADRVLDR